MWHAHLARDPRSADIVVRHELEWGSSPTVREGSPLIVYEFQKPRSPLLRGLFLLDVEARRLAKRSVHRFAISRDKSCQSRANRGIRRGIAFLCPPAWSNI